jgi:hypothetical protein
LQLKLLNIDVSGVPDVAYAVFRARDEMVGLAIVWWLSVHLDGTWDELDVGDVVLVRFVDVWHDKLLHLDSHLLALFLVFSIELGCLLLYLATLLDDVLLRAQVPRDKLAVDATANNHLRVFRGELDRRDFDGGLKRELGEDDLTVWEVKDQDLRIERFAHDLGPVVEGKVLNDAHSHQGWLLRVELDAGDSSVLGVWGLVEELAWHCVNSVHFGASSRLLVSQLLEIVLEDVDDFIGLQLALNSGSHTVDEGIKTLA